MAPGKWPVGKYRCHLIGDMWFGVGGRLARLGAQKAEVAARFREVTVRDRATRDVRHQSAAHAPDGIRTKAFSSSELA